MTYLDLIRSADRKLDKGDITLGEYEQMIEPMNREIQPEIVRCKDCKYYLHDEEYGFDWCNRMSGVFRAKPDGFCSWAVMRGGDSE